jgi:basic amino acid/polyamine antiporter, APA family
MTTVTTDAVPGAPEPGGLFARKSSGLVREVGVRDSLGIGLSLLLLIAVYSISAIFLGAFPNGDYYVPLLVGAVISGILAFAYAQLVATFPRAGGEYTYASRIFSPVAGAAVGGAALIALTYIGSINIVQTSQLYVPFMFSTVGDALGIDALVTFGSSTLTTKTAWIITGLVIVAICAVVCLRPIRSATRWVFWTFGIGLATHVLIAIILLFESRTGFINAFNAASGDNAYQEIIAQARAGGFEPGVKMGDVLALLPIGALLYLGFTFGAYAGGEIKRPATTYKVAVFGAIGVGAAGLLLGWAAMRHAVGLDFLQASASLAANDPDAYGKLTSVDQTQGGLAYAFLAAGDPVTSMIIGIGTFVAWLSGAVAIVLVSTRIVFALSFDRMLPTRMAAVHPRTHAPIYAVALLVTIVGIMTVLGNLTTVLTLARNFLLVINAVFVVGSICAAALPYRRPELFEASPKVFRGRLLGVPMITVVSTVAALAFSGLVIDVASRIEYSGGYSTGSIITLAVMATIGLLLYLVSRLSLSRRGIDVRLAMHELPPE